MHSQSSPKIIFVMGVSGSGKSSVGQLLATALSIPFIDADDHHPASNIEKMSQGIPLDDRDRGPWLEQLNQIAQAHLSTGCVMACSALKEKYRVQLGKGIKPHVIWVYLKGTYDQIFERMSQRTGHFMGASMLRSQFATLEEPKNALYIDITASPSQIIQHITSQIT